ncbi:putative disease resistance protein RGA3 [Triticum dicoccoides]|uniref:putative disease resistance protein RGA3 n=1 Tax=Triticum dicoccoides TaxID=85692 RepID=UPI00189069AA|nr:putative disease resistance protein RGA3 [Triticum dicoccoides]XP_037407981.1 putative disease resistance protein RGA3 [Triticum dicoccoides]XP_037407982.1 putative disease resistance protein RGA3 [Triticum dicoccoides]
MAHRGLKLDAPASSWLGNESATSPRLGNFSSALPVDSTFFGRGRELADLLERLVGCNGPAQLGNQGVPVVAIVGDGGIGKTTLAQMAFNDVSIQAHFDLRMWVCVSSCMHVMELTREILQLAKEGKDYRGVLNYLQESLVSAVAGKRFLLILDDVWNDNGSELWQNVDQGKALLSPLQNGQQGSRIVVTTRTKMVADMLGVRIPMMLVGLGAEEHWLLLKKHALVCEESSGYSQLKEIGRKIALKLRGSPLAAKVIGGTLSGTRRARDWNSILETDIHGDIVATLLSSYYHLPPHLQCCFAYCSIFPKNWKFEPKKLVRMWISQGFIQMENGRSMEDCGKEYFKQLLLRSFFQTVKQGNKRLYLMHDLIHDLAQMVSDGDCGRVEGDMSKNILPTIRHLSVSSNCLGKIKNQNYLKRLRTLIVFRDPLMPPSPIPDGFLAEIKNVRTLDFTGCDISKLPEAIDVLTHLRYIALPDTIKTIPESVSRLLHLQTFDIPKKCQLDGFPEGMHQLTSLRHLGIESKYISTIRGIGSLVNLQGSVEFHVKKEKGRTLEELKDMRDLHGLLSIKNLENVQCKEEACEAQLANKQHVNILKFEWSVANLDFGPNIDAEVLNCLQPHPNLEELHIARYKGASSPRWLQLKTLSHLKCLYLANCRRWEWLPPLGQLPSLRVLHLKEMNSVAEIGPSFYGGLMAFQSLKDLEFDDMPNLVRWTGETGNSFLPSLQKLKISNCPKLDEVPLLPYTIKRVTVERSKVSHLKLSPHCSSRSSKFMLENSSTSILSEGFLLHQQHLEATEVLNIRGCWGSVAAEKFKLLTSLRKLRLWQCDMDDARLNLCLQHLTVLASLEIIDCKNIKSFVLPVGSRYFTTLQHLCFENCLNLSSLATLESSIFLKSLIIERCPMVTAVSLPSEMKRMTSLNKLSISHCQGLQSLPSSIPPSLEFLHLVGCDSRLTEGLLERQGPEWEKITFISQITVY